MHPKDGHKHPKSGHKIAQEKIEAIKNYVDIAPFMQACGIDIKRNGRGHKGYCPFHEDKTPSLSVTPDKNLWQCFGCGKGGDIIEFVQLFDKVDFPTAVEKLATYIPENRKQKTEVRSQTSKCKQSSSTSAPDTIP